MTKITLDFAKKLCPDFNLVKRKDLGRSACIHLMPDSETCRRGNHFVCELVLYKLRAEAKEKRLEREAVSASRINLFDTCARKYHLSRNLYLKSPGGEPVFFRVGDAFSVARARIDRGMRFSLLDLRPDIPPVDLAKLRAVIRFYIEHPPYPQGEAVLTCEDHCQFEFEGTWFTGYSDVRTDGGKTIIDWKYAVNSYSHLEVARQAAVYLKGFPDAERFVIYRMRKPAYRPKKSGESMAEFEQRILDGFRKDGPGKVYSRTSIERDQIDVDGILREMKALYEIVLPAQQKAGWSPNYSSCELCDFSTVCGEAIGAPTSEIVRRLTVLKEPDARATR